MLTIFNRRELCITFSMDEQADIRNTLQTAGIDYRLKLHNSGGTVNRDGGHGMGRFGQSQQYACEYLFYVHKRDLAQARYALGR